MPSLFVAWTSYLSHYTARYLRESLVVDLPPLRLEMC